LRHDQIGSLGWRPGFDDDIQMNLKTYPNYDVLKLPNFYNIWTTRLPASIEQGPGARVDIWYGPHHNFDMARITILIWPASQFWYGPHHNFDMARITIFVTLLEHNIASKRSSTMSRYFDG